MFHRGKYIFVHTFNFTFIFLTNASFVWVFFVVFVGFQWPVGAASHDVFVTRAVQSAGALVHRVAIM